MFLTRLSGLVIYLRSSPNCAFTQFRRSVSTRSAIVNGALVANEEKQRERFGSGRVITDPTQTSLSLFRFRFRSILLTGRLEQTNNQWASGFLYTTVA